MTMLRLVYVDMDGVLTDFVGSVLRLVGSDLAPEDIRGFDSLSAALEMSEEEMWGRIDQAGEAFWADMPAYSWADELLREVQKRSDWVIATSPSHDVTCVAGKLKWLQRRFGRQFRRYVMSPMKGCLSLPGTVLVDDSPRNVAEFEAGYGHAVLFPQPWNGAGEAWDDDKVAYVACCLDSYDP